MAPNFHLAGTAFLFVALVLSFLGSISLPYLPALDYTRVLFSGTLSSGTDSLTEVRWGIWGPCLYDLKDRICLHTGHAYAVPLFTEDGQLVIIGASWTRGLAIHPVTAGVVAIAFGFAVSRHEHGPLIASLMSFFAAFMLLIAFAIDIALFAFVHHEVGKLHDVGGNVNAGSAFWMTLVELILVLLAGCTVTFARRKEGGGDSYPMFSNPSAGGFFSRFRKN